MLEKSSRVIASLARIAIGIVLIVLCFGFLQSMCKLGLMPETIMGSLFDDVCRR
jgi:hypothetical protein